MPLGLYISVPFCRTKCTYCNFASDVFSRAVFDKYVSRLCHEISSAEHTAEQMGGSFELTVDSIYFGGGTPTLLDVAQLERIFVTIRQNFDVQSDAEITLECAPGTLSDEKIAAMAHVGVNRVSLGVQSFVDREAASVGRLHKRDTVLDDIARLRSAGISNVNVDLIAGLPHQNRESWYYSLTELIAIGVPHASVYMLEVDEDSRLGRELLAGGQKYHAHFVPDEDLTAELYEIACERLNAAGIHQYEISNFAREGFESKHNLKYWTRHPYFGFGMDAHSMLPAVPARYNSDEDQKREGHDFQSCRNTGDSTDGTAESRALTDIPEYECTSAVRLANPENLEQYVSGAPRTKIIVSSDAALQEALFLGLRLNRGLSLDQLRRKFGHIALAGLQENIKELISDGLLLCQDNIIRLTPRGRLLSNEVFERFVSVASAL